MKHRIALLMVLLMLSLPMASAQRPASGQDIDYTREEIVIIRNDTAGFVKLKLGEAEMSIHYGDGPISMLTIQTRYLGIADMYDEDDRHRKRVGIPVENIMWQRLIGTMEYVDSNENGLFNIDSSHAIGTIDEMVQTAGDHEQILKAVDYRDVSWTLSRWSENTDGNEVRIDFELSAENIPYNDGHQDQRVTRIAYLFHVTTVEQDIQIDAVPHYKVDFAGDENDPDIRGSELIARTNVTGHVLNSTWKYDQHIEGWDVTERNDTRLFTLTEMAMGSKLHPKVGEWMRDSYGHLVSPRAIAGLLPSKPDEAPIQFQDRDQEGHPLKCGLDYVRDTDADGDDDRDDDDGDADAEERQRVRDKIRHYEETACRQRGDEIAAGDMEKPEVIRAGTLRFDDNGANMGRIRWVSNATVDDVETEVLFQIHGARKVIAADVSGSDGLFIGVRLVGGYNYVAGNDSYHDPEFGADVLTIDPQGFTAPLDQPVRKGLMKLISLVSVLVIVVVTIGMAASRRREAPMPDASYTPTGPWASEDANWEQYRKN